MGNKHDEEYSSYEAGAKYDSFIWDVLYKTDNIYTYHYKSKDLERIGEDNPFYKAIIRRGGDATNGLFLTVEDDYCSPALLSYKAYDDPSRPSRYHYMEKDLLYPGIYSVPAHIPEGPANRQAYSAFWRNLVNARTKWNSAQFVGELREVASMIKNPARGISRGFETLSRRVEKHARRSRNRKALLSTVGDLWLEAQFGWRPLLNDLHSASEAWLHLSTPRVGPEWQKISGFGTCDDKGELRSPLTVAGSLYSRFRRTYRYDRRASVRYRGAISIAEGFQLTQQTFGLSMENFIPTIWELLPWSFMVDYFTNVQEVLDAASIGYSVLKWSNRTTVFETNVYINDHPLVSATKALAKAAGNYDSVDIFAADGGGRKLTRKKIVRSRFTPPLPRLRFDLSLSGGQLANIGALIASGERATSYARKL